MTNTPAATPATPNPQPTKPKHAPSDLSQADLATLTTAEQMGLNAQNGLYASLLLAEDPDLTDAWVAAFLQLIAATRGGQQTHKDDRAAVKGDTKAEAKIKNNLIELINEIRGRAKVTYAATAPEKLVLYSVGVDIRDSRKVLEAAADGIIEELKTDTVLKINPAKVAQLAPLTAAYKSANVTQSGDNVAAKNQQGTVKANVAQVVAGRQKIQVAANGAFAYTNPANAATRQLFGLPPNKTFSPGLTTSA